MQYMHPATQPDTASAVPATDTDEPTIQDVLNGMVTFDEYQSSKED